MDPTVEIPGEDEPARGRQRSRQERGRLLDAPDLVQGSHVVGGELSLCILLPGHFKPGPSGGVSSRALLQDDLPGHDLHAGLTQRDHESLGPRMVGSRVPVVSPGGGWADREPLIELYLPDVRAVREGSRLSIHRFEDVLKDRLRQIDVLAGLAIDLPEDAVLPHRQERGYAVDVD